MTDALLILFVPVAALVAMFALRLLENAAGFLDVARERVAVERERLQWEREEMRLEPYDIVSRDDDEDCDEDEPDEAWKRGPRNDEDDR